MSILRKLKKNCLDIFEDMYISQNVILII